MGGYASRNRAWVHIAFYDEYANRNIGYSAGLSVFFMVPLYWYGIYINRCKEIMCAANLYNWHFTDKRNRLTHNMIMEHFEVHTEQAQDIILSVQTYGPQILDDIPEFEDKLQITEDDLALIDEISGLKEFVETIILNTNMPQHVQAKMRSRIAQYSGKKTKEELAFNLHTKFYGRQR